MQESSIGPDADVPLNGDLARRVAIDTRGMEWTASPSSTVWRKRLHRVGPAESGQVVDEIEERRPEIYRTHLNVGL